MKWIIFFMKPSGERFSYTTNILHPEKSSMSYHKFLQFIFKEFPVWHREAFIKEVECFQTILLHSSGEWEVIKPDIDSSKYSFEELSKYQEKLERQKNKSGNVFLDTAKNNLNTDTQESLLKNMFKKAMNFDVKN